MDTLNTMFKSILDQDRCAIVVCDLNHTIVYMNPMAITKQAKRGGAALIGQNLLNCHNPESVEKIHKVVEWFQKDKNNNWIYTFHNEKENKDGYMIALRSEDGTLIGYYEKHEYRNPETMTMYDFT